MNIRQVHDTMSGMGTDAILLHGPSGAVLYAGPTLAPLLGMDDVTSVHNVLDVVHPDERRELKNAFTRGLIRGTAYGPARHRIHHRDIGWRDVDIVTLPVRNATGNVIELHTTMIDITERRQAQERTAVQEKLLRETNALAKVGGWQLDVDTGALYWSDEVRRIHDVTDDYVPTLDAAIAFFGAEARPVIGQAMEDAMTKGGNHDLELPVVTANGRNIWVRTLLKTEYGAGGRPKRLFGAYQDITERKEQERRLESAIDRLTKHNKQLEEFGEIMSHNLRAPVSNLVMLLHMLDQVRTELDRRELIANLSSSVDQLVQTLDDVTTAVRVRTGNAMPAEHVSVEAVLERITAELAQAINAKGAVLRYNLLACTHIDVSPVYLEHILFHLLQNALVYASPDRTPVIDIDTRLVQDHAVIRVTDNGLGIDLERYGDKLFRLRTTFHRHHQGRGAGLFLVKNIVESIGGTINVWSAVGNGSTFEVQLPVKGTHR
ncbi:MAG: PAS domain-containing sensor histidine kinase ['Candidatus Kapabacteria' thiocyanatum]|nr:PAS domain-containing sensor histidine kinase ['Candidatus Kapabacteria' thiocyanatum]